MKTVKARIRVAVDVDGKWMAYGWTDADAESVDPTVTDGMPEDSAEAHWNWVTVVAELPVPAVSDFIVDGKVLEGEE